MVKIRVLHKFRSKTVTMDVSENIIAHAENGENWAIRRIFENYLKLCDYQRGNLQYRSIKFWRVKSKKIIKQTFAHRTDNFSACERENCSFCNNGQYEKCPNNHHI